MRAYHEVMAEVTSVPVGNLVLYGVAVVAPTLGFWLVLKVPGWSAPTGGGAAKPVSRGRR
jgi:hypothetical protein